MQDRDLFSYQSEMSHLGEENPDVLAYLRSGGFSVQIGSMKTFGRIAVNQTYQETE